MEKNLEFLALQEDEGLRMDVFLAKKSGISRSHIQSLVLHGAAACEDAPVRSKDIVRAGQTVVLNVPEPKVLDNVPQNIPLDIVYQDKYLAVINKSRGMVVHPAAGNADNTLVNALLHHIDDLSGIGGVMRPGIVHRLDKDTSGLMLVAKSDAAHEALSLMFKDHSIKRVYLALVDGNFREDEGTVDKPLCRNPNDRKKIAVAKKGGRNAVTHWKVIERFGNYTLISCILETGRTHQIRVHMASISHPLVGDTLYGPGKQKLGFSGQALHSAELEFIHPINGEDMVFSAPLPDYFISALEKLRKQSGLRNPIE